MQFANDRTDLVKRIEHLEKRKCTQGMTLTKISKNRKRSQKLT